MLIRRWRHFSSKEKAIFLVLFAVLLPTMVLLYSQYQTLSALRVLSKDAFENSLRQTFVEIESNLDERLIEEARATLQDFPETDLQTWSSQQVKENLPLIIRKNSGVEAVFIMDAQPSKNEFDGAAFSEAKGYREARGKKNPFELSDALGEDDFSFPLRSIASLTSGQPLEKMFFIAQSRCKRCPADGQPVDDVYLYRVLSDPQIFPKLRFIGVRLKQDYVMTNVLSPVAAAAVGASDKKLGAEIVLGVFDEQKNLLFSTDAGGADVEKSEVKANLSRVLPLWTMTGSFRNNSIEDLSNTYFRRGFTLTVLILGLLMLGVILLGRVTKREFELSVSKSAFVSNVSHELKTPLALIRLFAETLQSGRVKNPEKVQEYYRIINTESIRLTHLINNILDFSAIEAGRKEYNFAPCDLSQLVGDVVRNYTFSLENAGFTVESNFAENLPLVSVDGDAISQAVINLLNNAAKYSTDEKNVVVSVERRRENIAIEITDHGIGIAPDEQANIFEDFYRVGGSNDVHNVKGSGLGLALVKHISEAHGGRVTVHSVLHRGSTFTILLPIETANTKRKKL